MTYELSCVDRILAATESSYPAVTWMSLSLRGTPALCLEQSQQ